jgi:hypothetical protein
MKLRPIEYVYLLVALAIVAQQLIVRRGEFDPIALGAVALFISLIPGGRVDRRAADEGGTELADSLVTRILRAILGERGG